MMIDKGQTKTKFWTRELRLWLDAIDAKLYSLTLAEVEPHRLFVGDPDAPAFAVDTVIRMLFKGLDA